MTLIPNWRALWRMASVWCFIATLIVVGVWLSLAWLDGAYAVTNTDLALLGALQVLGIASRGLAQPDVWRQLLSDLTSPIEDEAR